MKQPRHHSLTGLGMRIREIRRKRGMTLQEVARKTGLSAGLLSQIENARTSPSLPVLCEIAEALSAVPSELLGGEAPSVKKRHSGERGRGWILVHPEDHEDVLRETSSGYRYRQILESPLRAGELQMMIVEVQPGAVREKITGSGVESLYVLCGHGFYHLGARRLELKEGDMLFFDSSIPHVPENPGPAALRFLVNYYLTPNIFEEI